MLTFSYPIELSYFNGTEFLLNDVLPVANFTPSVTVNQSIETVLFDLDEKDAQDSITTLVRLILTNSIRFRTVYEVSFEVDWHSLPYSFEGGRSYHHSGVIPFSTDDLQISIEYITSNSLTPNASLQLQEYVFANVTVIFPEVYPYFMTLC